MNFMFEWQYLTSERSELVRYCSSQRVMFFLLYGETNSTKNDTTLTKVTYGKYATRVPDEVAYGIYEWFSSQ